MISTVEAAEPAEKKILPKVLGDLRVLCGRTWRWP